MSKEEKQLSVADVVFNFDIIEKFKPMLGKRYRIDPQLGKIRQWNELTQVEFDTPWVHVHQDPKRCCHHYMGMFAAANLIPPRCMSCWKIVVRPRTIVELFDLLSLMELQVKKAKEQGDDRFFCKCGIEIREYVHALYGGYYYTDSKEAGFERWKQVRADVNEAISPDVSVILKRACTELEMKVKDSAKYEEWNNSINADQWLARIDEHFEVEKGGHIQPPFIKQHVMCKWLKFAWSNADETVLKLNDEQPLFYSPIRTYHEEMLQEEIREEKQKLKKGGKDSGRKK